MAVTLRTDILMAPKGLPECWVVYEGVIPVMFPARQHGWSERKPYRGHLEGLTYARPKLALGTGWPPSAQK